MSALREIPVQDIRPHELNPRRAIGDVTELAKSIDSQGLVQPIVIAPADEPEAFVIIAGHRRFAAVTDLGWMTVPALVREDLTDPADIISAMLVENGQRNDLTITEEGDALLALEDLGLSRKAIAERAGRSAKWTKTRLTVAGLPAEMRDAVDDAQLTIADAMAYAELDDAARSQVDVTKPPKQVASAVARQVRTRTHLEKADKLRAQYTAAGAVELGDDEDIAGLTSAYKVDETAPPEGARFRIQTLDGQLPPYTTWYVPKTNEDDGQRNEEREKARKAQDRAKYVAELGKKRIRAAVVNLDKLGDYGAEEILRNQICALRKQPWAHIALSSFDHDFDKISDDEARSAGWLADLTPPELVGLVWICTNAWEISRAITPPFSADDPNADLETDKDMLDALVANFDLELSDEERALLDGEAFEEGAA